ncbi:MAG: SPOR domain-containing protein [Gammaproteobacteria bacterium]
METTLKQRLIGAAVIIALAVIFVPMILDGSGQQESVAINMEAPPKPKFTFESDLPDPKKLDELPPIEKKADTTQSSEKESVATEATPTPKKEASVTEEGTQSVVVEATANHIKPNPALSAWAVQVAAFGEKDKALALQEKLLAGNYQAFTEKSANGNKVLYRVKVGPELKRDNAEKLRDKIEKEHGFSGSFVTNHP